MKLKLKHELTEDELYQLDLDISEKYRFILGVEERINVIKTEEGLSKAKKELKKMCEDYKNKSRQE